MSSVCCSLNNVSLYFWKHFISVLYRMLKYGLTELWNKVILNKSFLHRFSGTCRTFWTTVTFGFNICWCGSLLKFNKSHRCVGQGIFFLDLDVEKAFLVVLFHPSFGCIYYVIKLFSVPKLYKHIILTSAIVLRL